MVLFQWDPAKAQYNFEKHGVSFDEAVTVFLDPEAEQFFDISHSQAEDRFWILGESHYRRRLHVVYTFRRSLNAKEDCYYFRIISARVDKKK